MMMMMWYANVLHDGLCFYQCYPCMTNWDNFGLVLLSTMLLFAGPIFALRLGVMV